MSTEDPRRHVEVQRARAATARRAADALLTGDDAPARGLLTAAWHLDDPAAHALLGRLVAGPPLPPDGRVRATLDPLDRPLGEAARWILRERLRGADHGPVTDRDRLAWALDELAFVGAEVERRERRAWGERAYTVAPELDARVANLWVQLAARNYWGREAGGTYVLVAWEELMLPAAERALRAVLAARAFPDHVRRDANDRLCESFSVLFTAEPPLWPHLACRVVETTGDGPVTGLAEVWGAATRQRLAQCAASQGQRAATVSLLFDRPDLPTRVRDLLATAVDQPDLPERFLDAHVVHRLCTLWARGQATDPDGTWNVVLQNRAKARSRIRAAAAELDSDALLARLLAVDALAERTRDAVARVFFSLLRGRIRHDFQVDPDQPVTAPCPEVAEPVAPLEPELASVLRTWVLLVGLSGRLDHLERWVRTGSTGDHDARWGRLLAYRMPEALKDPAVPGRRQRTYARVRMELSDALVPMLESLLPAFDRVRALPTPGKGFAAVLQEAVAPWWESDEVPFPRNKLGLLHHRFVEAGDRPRRVLERLRAAGVG